MTSSIAAAPVFPSTNDDLPSRWLGEVPIYVIAAALLSICVGLLMSHGVALGFGAIIENTRLFLLFAVVLAIYDAVRQLFRHRPSSPIGFLKERYSSPALRNKIVSGLPLLAVAILALPFFSKMKSAIPLFNDYTWDATFIEWDRALFFGNNPWEVMQPVIGFPVVTAFLALLYHLWFLLLYPGVMFFVFAKMDSSLRRQFFLTYALSWALVGGLMATMLASVGPCFLGPILGDWHYGDQMDYLYAANNEVPIMVLNVQEMLLEWYAEAENGLGSGITAMPSMHCAIAFLYWLAVRRIHKGWGVFFGVFFLVIWISSVHLAYHYSVDGLISLIAVAAIWKFSQAIIGVWDGFVARRFGPQATLRTNTVPAE